LNQSLRIGWLVLLILPTIGLIFLVGGILSRKIGFIIPGGIIFGVGIGLFAGFQSTVIIWAAVIGKTLVGLAFGFVLITLCSALFTAKPAWWALIPFAVIAALGGTFWFTSLRIVDFVLYGVTSVGLVLLFTGVFTRLFGLIIPGCLLVGIGPGVFMAWGTPVEQNGLAQTGLMLVWIALGWGLITLFSRVITDKFTWWPLIPGGVIATVGWGLYIGGNPGNAISFISNTGSVGLIIFGLYLLLLRRGIQR
jgi:hypothetical protein